MPKPLTLNPEGALYKGNLPIMAGLPKTPQGPILSPNVSYSLKFLKGSCIGDSIGDCTGFLKGDTRTLDYGIAHMAPINGTHEGFLNSLSREAQKVTPFSNTERSEPICERVNPYSWTPGDRGLLWGVALWNPPNQQARTWRRSLPHVVVFEAQTPQLCTLNPNLGTLQPFINLFINPKP